MCTLKNGTGCEIRETKRPIGRLDHARTSNKLRPWPGVPPLYSFWVSGSGGDLFLFNSNARATPATQRDGRAPNVEERSSLFLPFLEVLFFSLLSLSLFPFLFSFLSLARLSLSLPPLPSSFLSLRLSLSHCSAISRPEPAKIVSAVLDSACGSFQRRDTHQHRRPPLVLLPSRSTI